MASECQDILETESETIFLFFSLGQGIEELDRQLRLQQDENNDISEGWSYCEFIGALRLV